VPHLLLVGGIVVWSTVMASRLTRRLWPVWRGIPALMRAEFVAGGLSLVLLAAAGRAHLATEAGAVCLCAAFACGLLAGGVAARRRYRDGLPVVRRSRGKIPASHVYIWVDAICGVVAAAAPPMIVSPSSSRLSVAIGAVIGGGAVAVVTAVKQSARLRGHNRMVSSAGALASVVRASARSVVG
jgi:hypothetical protein